MCWSMSPFWVEKSAKLRCFHLPILQLLSIHSWNNTEWRWLFSPCLLVPLIHHFASRLSPKSLVFKTKFSCLNRIFLGSKWPFREAQGIPRGLDVPPPLPLLNTRIAPKTSAWLRGKSPTSPSPFEGCPESSKNTRIPVICWDHWQKNAWISVYTQYTPCNYFVNVIQVCCHIMPLW